MVKGFSLLELLVVLAIVAILSALAYPSYWHHLLQAHREEAQIQMVAMANQLEDYHSLNDTYESAALDQFAIPPNTHYHFDLLNLSATDYLIKASPTHAQTADYCGELTLDAFGKKQADHEHCW